MVTKRLLVMTIDWEVTREAIADLSPETPLWDGFDKAFVGLEVSTGKAVYCEDKLSAILMERDGMDIEEAMEYLSFNVYGSYIGEMTPLHIKIF